ncbi:hypothetical protein H0H92_005345, partial [Tricholoma furcatifolium]
KNIAAFKNWEEYGDVQFWERDKWQEYVDRKQNQGRPIDRLAFLVDSESTDISKTQLKKMTETVRGIWEELRHNNMDPVTWKKKTNKAKEFFLPPHAQ